MFWWHPEGDTGRAKGREGAARGEDTRKLVASWRAGGPKLHLGGSQVSRWGQLYELFRFSPVHLAMGLHARLEIW